MANPEHLRILTQGVKVWNQWLDENLDIEPDFENADLSNLDLRGVNLRNANIRNANLANTDLRDANLADVDWAIDGANFSNAKLGNVDFEDCTLKAVNFKGADLERANFRFSKVEKCDFENANLVDANLFLAEFNNVNFRGAILKGADLEKANLSEANLSKAIICDANLYATILNGANIDGAVISNSLVFGVSVWGLQGEFLDQRDLIISKPGESILTVDNIEVAQFIYLLLNNKKIRDVIDTIARKVVLILGRFTSEHKPVLDAIREELRKLDYLPVLFDFKQPATRNTRETVRTLAHLSRFIIADLTEPKSIPLELETIVPELRVPVQPILLRGYDEFSMFDDLRKTYHWVLATHQYTDITDLLASLGNKVIKPAEQKAQELSGR